VRYAVLALLFFTTTAFAQVRIEDAWARATAPGAKVGAGYMKIHTGVADRLIGATTPVAARVEMHVTEQKGEVMRMREVKAYAIPVGGVFELSPGGAHLMLVDLKAPLRQGSKVPLTLRFEKAGEMKVELEVRALGASRGHSH